MLTLFHAVTLIYVQLKKVLHFSMCNQLWRLDDKGARSFADPLLAHVNGHKGGQEMLIL